MYPQSPRCNQQMITPRGVLLVVAAMLAAGYVLRRPIFHHTGMSLQRRWKIWPREGVTP